MTVIRVGAAPEPYETRGLYFDGDTAVGDLAQVSVDEPPRMLVISRIGFAEIRWPLDDLRLLPDLGGQDLVILRLRDDPVARLILDDDLLLERLPDVRRRAPVTRRGRLVGWAVAALGSVALIITVLVPTMADQLAEYIPPEGERALGETTLTQIRSALDESGFGQPVPLCDAPEGQAALAKMEARLTDQMPGHPALSVHVLDHEMINAFALPGGYLVFFRGLLEAAETPEEVAAVFAHEIGHVISRDPTRHALRSAGSIGVLGLVLGDFAGGALVLFMAERLIQATYSRAAEAEADAFGRDLLIKSGIDPAAMGVFFGRLQTLYGDDTGITRHFASHPALSDRILAAEGDLPEGFETHPILDAGEWAALQAICR